MGRCLAVIDTIINHFILVSVNTLPFVRFFNSLKKWNFYNILFENHVIKSCCTVARSKYLQSPV